MAVSYSVAAKWLLLFSGAKADKESKSRMKSQGFSFPIIWDQVIVKFINVAASLVSNQMLPDLVFPSENQ